MRNVKPVRVGDCVLNGEHIYIQSMLNARSDDIEGSVRQAVELEKAGCEIIRAAIPNMSAVKLIPAIKEAVKIPLVADIHFDYRLAIESAAAGVDKIRINPGNIGGMDRVKKVVDACRARNLPIRIGVNSGSLEKEILAKYGSPTPEALVESAMTHAAMLEHFDFDDIVISIKSSDVQKMIACYRLAAQKCNYPLHLGVTEAGTERMGLIKSAVGIGSLLCDGIGVTIRVSLTDDPVREIEAAKDILRCIGKRGGVKLVSCPTCGRTRIDLIGTAKKVEEAVKDLDKNITVAVMGCIVNGPGEMADADYGYVGAGRGQISLYKGKECVLKNIPEEDAVERLVQLIKENGDWVN